MSDIVEMMCKIANKEFGTYDVRDDSVRVGCETLRNAIAEIERLRCQVTDLTRLAGCAAIGKEFSDIKNEASEWQDVRRKGLALLGLSEEAAERKYVNNDGRWEGC